MKLRKFAQQNLCKTPKRGLSSTSQRVKLLEAPLAPAAGKIIRFPSRRSLGYANASLNSRLEFDKEAKAAFLRGLVYATNSVFASDLLGGVAGSPRRGGDMEPRSGGMRGETSPTKRIKPGEKPTRADWKKLQDKWNRKKGV